MAKNIELKLKVSSHKEIISKIKKNGIKYVGLLNQKDVYYSFDKGLLKLRIENGEYQLIKYQRDEFGNERWSNYSILSISGDNVEDYLQQLFTEEIIVEKKRNLYIHDNTRIHLDTVKQLGDFIELETVADKITEFEAINEFNYIMNLLSLNAEKEIRKSYRDLLL